MRPRTISRDQVRALRQQGLTMRAIAAKLGCSTCGVFHVLCGQGRARSAQTWTCVICTTKFESKARRMRVNTAVCSSKCAEVRRVEHEKLYRKNYNKAYWLKNKPRLMTFRYTRDYGDCAQISALCCELEKKLRRMK